MSDDSLKVDLMGARGGMRSLSQEIDRLRLDKRLVDLNIKRKTLTQVELQRHLDALPDLADNVMRLDLEDETLN